MLSLIQICGVSWGQVEDEENNVKIFLFYGFHGLSTYLPNNNVQKNKNKE